MVSKVSPGLFTVKREKPIGDLLVTKGIVLDDKYIPLANNVSSINLTETSCCSSNSSP